MGARYFAQHDGVPLEGIAMRYEAIQRHRDSALPRRLAVFVCRTRPVLGQDCRLVDVIGEAQG